MTPIQADMHPAREPRGAAPAGLHPRRLADDPGGVAAVAARSAARTPSRQQLAWRPRVSRRRLARQPRAGGAACRRAADESGRAMSSRALIRHACIPSGRRNRRCYLTTARLDRRRARSAGAAVMLVPRVTCERRQPGVDISGPSDRPDWSARAQLAAHDRRRWCRHAAFRHRRHVNDEGPGDEPGPSPASLTG